MRRAPGFGLPIFLIANQQYRDILKGPARLQYILHPDEICSDNSLHICRAATPQVLSLDTRRELGVIGFGFHYVKMTCQQDFIRTASDSVNRWEPCIHRRVFAIVERYIQPGIAQIVVDQRAGAVDFVQAFVRRSSHGWDPYQLLGQVQDFRRFIGIGDLNDRLCSRPKADRRCEKMTDDIPRALDELGDLGCICAQRAVITGNAFHIGFDLGFAFVEQFPQNAQGNFIVLPQLHMEAGADLFGGIASAFGHFDQWG